MFFWRNFPRGARDDYQLHRRPAVGGYHFTRIMSTDKTRIVIVGSKGRMGEALLRLAALDPKLELTAGIDKGDNVLDVIDRTDVLIEFAHHSLSGDLAKVAAEHGNALVVGTTGHTAEERKAIEAASKRIPVVFAPNFSVGVNLLFYLTQIAAETLGENYDQEVV
jgi:4-hydroxy-tetrahydrodipicolinate reductase